MPTPGDYQEAIQNPKNTLKDEELKDCMPEVNKLGIPFGRTGNFAVTYKMVGRRKKYAVKCFTREALDIRKRYDMIHRFLESKGSDYFINFHYIDNAILINGEWLPILKMEWVENGELITKYIERNLRNKDELKNLLKQLCDLAVYLEQEKLSHGDLQAGNIMVVNKKLKLIDYDGMHVPGMNFARSNEIGHENFQHPKRGNFCTGEKLDRFSSIVLYLGIKALIYKPELWEKYYDDVDVMIKKNDFENPNSSKFLSEICKIADMKEEAEKFMEICKGRFEDIPHINEYLYNRQVEEENLKISMKYDRIENKYVLPIDYLVNKNVKEELRKFDKIPESNFEGLILLKDYNDLLALYILPFEISDLKNKSLDKYNEIMNFIKKNQKDFIKNTEYNDMKRNYILPDEMQSDFLKNTTKENYLSILKKIKDNRELLITKKDFYELREKYILSESVLRIDDENITKDLYSVDENRPWYIEARNYSFSEKFLKELKNDFRRVKENYYIPEQLKNIEKEEDLILLMKYKGELLTKKEYKKLDKKYFLPFELKFMESSNFSIHDFIGAIIFVRNCDEDELVKKSILRGKIQQEEFKRVTVKYYERLRKCAEFYKKEKMKWVYIVGGA